MESNNSKMKFSKAIILFSISMITLFTVFYFIMCFMIGVLPEAQMVVSFFAFYGTELFALSRIKISEINAVQAEPEKYESNGYDEV